MRLLDARQGKPIQIKQRRVPFSLFPTYRSTRREGLQSILFATDPWNVISGEIEKIQNVPAKKQARAFCEQARDFFISAYNADISAAKPLLLYYSFLNLAKCFVVYRKEDALRSRIQHGLEERLPTSEGATHGLVNIYTQNPNENAFHMFAKALKARLPSRPAPNAPIQIRSQDFLSQILIGHRLFCQSIEGYKERFISLEQIDYMYDSKAKEAWLRVRAYKDDFTRLGYNLTNLSKNLSNTQNQLEWRNVNCYQDGRPMIEAETILTVKYSDRPSQAVQPLSQKVRSKLWRSATIYAPYRKYYIYNPASTQILLDQLLTIYLATFYFGSITRYKPEQFEGILKSTVGPFVLEFFANQPSQFLYLMASEFTEREIAKAAIT